MTTNGRFIWHDLITADTKRALPFYQELFGWKAVTKDMGGGRTYTLFMRGDRQVGGAMSSEQSQGSAPRWNVYFTHPDVEGLGLTRCRPRSPRFTRGQSGQSRPTGGKSTSCMPRWSASSRRRS